MEEYRKYCSERFCLCQISNYHGNETGTYHDWRIWDGTTTRTIGDLPIELRSLEIQCVWGDEALEERIASGTYRGQQMFCFFPFRCKKMRDSEVITSASFLSFKGEQKKSRIAAIKIIVVAKRCCPSYTSM